MDASRQCSESACYGQLVRTFASNLRTWAHQDVFVCNLNKSGYMNPFIVINGISLTY